MFKLLATLGTSLILLAGCTSNPQLIAQLTEECKTLQGTTYLGPLGEWELCGEELHHEQWDKVELVSVSGGKAIINGGHRTAGSEKDFKTLKKRRVPKNKLE